MPDFPVTREQHEDWLKAHLNDCFQVAHNQRCPLYSHIAEVTGNYEISVCFDAVLDLGEDIVECPKWASKYQHDMYDTHHPYLKGLVCLKILREVNA